MRSAKKIELWNREVRAYGYLGGWSVIAVLTLFYRVRCKPIPQDPREARRAWQADYYYRHHEERKAAARKRMRAYRLANPEKVRENYLRWFRKHREDIAYRKKLRRCGVTPEARTVDTVDKVDTVDRARKATAGMEVKRGI